VLTKSIGTTNPLTLSRATLEGLAQLRSRREIAELRGVAIGKEGADEA
jgi:small subunit ribosomal protein S5